MKKLILLLVLCASSAAMASVGKDLSNMFCGPKLKAAAQKALYPTDGSDSIWIRDWNNPNKWYSADKQYMKSTCASVRRDFPKYHFRGIRNQWYCGFRVTSCWYELHDKDDKQRKKRSSNDEDGGNGGGGTPDTGGGDGGNGGGGDPDTGGGDGGNGGGGDPDTGGGDGGNGGGGDPDTGGGDGGNGGGGDPDTGGGGGKPDTGGGGDVPPDPDQV